VVSAVGEAPYVDAREQLVVNLFVRDLGRSVAFYRRLGFELLGEQGRFAALAWEGHWLLLEERDRPPAPDAPPQGNVRVMVPDVDRYWQLATELGLPVLGPIADRWYGLRDFTVLDPDGFGIRFASRLADR
jgi:catechol 2,3-dioxygenase-like lactoylglutathione lyase family enzyme